MKIEIEEKLPEELLEFKINHYKEIFKEKWEQVFSTVPCLQDEVYVLRDFGTVLGGCVVQKGVYDVKFKNFAVLPKSRGKGVAKALMSYLEDAAKAHHQRLVVSGQKPDDIKLMYLKSVVYPEEAVPQNSAGEFSLFLKKKGFSSFKYNKYELSEEEKIGIKAYPELYPGIILKVFKKPVVNEGVRLNDAIQKELSSLSKREWDIVMNGLNWKLGNYDKTGEVSYKYNICPICKDMKSDAQNSENCKKCYIHITCMEPFRQVGFFKENYEVSNAYFSEMRDFMTAHQPK